MATDGEDRRLSGDTESRPHLPGFGGGGEFAQGDPSFRTLAPKQRSGAEKKEQDKAGYDLGPTGIPMGSSRCRGSGGRSFGKRDVSDPTQPETEGSSPAPKRTMSGNCDEEREDAHTEAPASVSPECGRIYLSREKRKYERSDIPKKRLNQSRVGAPTRETSGKNKFAARLGEKRKTRVYALLVRTWSSIPSLVDIPGRGHVRRGWLQVARRCRGEML